MMLSSEYSTTEISLTLHYEAYSFYDQLTKEDKERYTKHLISHRNKSIRALAFSMRKKVVKTNE